MTCSRRRFLAAGASALAAMPVSKAMPAAGDDPYEELKKLKELLDLGIITREEFERKKASLLW
ncbi:MAG: SHOCT domain-containing protein [Thermoguttaceae bacterium]|nr:SHOCT domain-containing protein [Thermoguttaceae bacterium]